MSSRLSPSNLIILLLLLASSHSRKLFTIEILSQTTWDFETCELAQQFAIEWVNNRHDILPNYNLTLEIQHEGLMGSRAFENLVRFIRKHDDEDNFDQYAASPISIGPLFTPGCKAVGKFLHHVDHVVLSTTSTASQLNNRLSNPNLFLALSTHNPKVLGILRFMREIGGWNKFALFTNPTNANDFDFALVFYEFAVQLGMEVVLFDSILNFNHEAALALKNSHARVIVIWASLEYFDFYCKVWDVGIKGERYVFFTFNKNFWEFWKYECPEALEDQFQRAFLLPVTFLSGDPEFISISPLHCTLPLCHLIQLCNYN